jgi:hypothetical protein
MFGVALTGCADGSPDFETALDLSRYEQGDIIALRADGADVEYISRRTGEIFRLTGNPSAPNATELVATIDVGTDGEQRGLLGQTVIGQRRFAAWTEPTTLDLVVGEVTSGRVDRLVWAGTSTASKAVGGHLDVLDGQLLLGIGELTGWGREHGSGALVLLDPDGGPDQDPLVLSDGWNNPFAFTVTSSGEVWVADNAPDGSDLPVAQREGERIARVFPVDGPALLEPPPQRAPAAIVELPDGRLGVCGFLDGEMRAYDTGRWIDGPRTDGPADSGTRVVGLVDDIERAGTIGPCQTGAVVLDDGSIVTVGSNDDGPVLLRRPPT